nr:retrovirus-related Pol polyprotein from transposon TNT 1-94 [Tanacetum cinerariifolium]
MTSCDGIGTPMATKHLDADLSGTPIDQTKYRSKDCTSMSSAEAEYVSLSTCFAQVLWMRTQLTDYGFHFDKIPIPSHEGYQNTSELPDGNNVVPLRSDTIQLVENGCSFHGLRSEDLNQHLKDFPKLVDSLDLDVANRERTRTIDQAAGGKLRDKNAKESWALLEDLALYDNKSWNDPREFAKLVKAISLPQDGPSTSDRRLIELENQVQRLMEAYLALTPPIQMNKINSHSEM